MKILGSKPHGHDGALALVSDGRLDFSIEQEKDSNPRNCPLTPAGILKVFEKLQEVPDVLAVGGWEQFGEGYFGINNVSRAKKRFFGKEVECFSSSHERSHIFGAYGMSHFENKRPCYALTWEGAIGSFYRVDEKMAITEYPVLFGPGVRYAYLYYLAKKNYPVSGNWFHDNSMAGKLMALAAYGRDSERTDAEREILDFLLTKEVDSVPAMVRHFPVKKSALPFPTPFADIGEEHEALKQVAYKLSDALFDTFYKFAAAHLTDGLPLLISGGCGLNCDWNSKWKDCGLFPDVFVPPCANDAGSAIGTAVDAQHYYTGDAKITWSVYAGEEFIEDCPDPSGWTRSSLNLDKVAALLNEGNIIPWVQGKYEIGPRALGNRSLLAAPFRDQTTVDLNRVKARESYRPIAPVCIEEDVSQHFDWKGPSPFMLYFQKVKNPNLRAVTHVDGSARVQTVSKSDNAALYALLNSFKRLTGTGVLCNTSLNFRGKGFINKKSDVLKYAEGQNLNFVVINDHLLAKT